MEVMAVIRIEMCTVIRGLCSSYCARNGVAHIPPTGRGRICLATLRCSAAYRVATVILTASAPRRLSPAGFGVGNCLLQRGSLEPVAELLLRPPSESQPSTEPDQQGCECPALHRF